MGYEFVNSRTVTIHAVKPGEAAAASNASTSAPSVAQAATPKHGFLYRLFHLAQAVDPLRVEMNRIDALLGQFVGNPWTLPPVYAAGYALGRKLLQYPRRRVPDLPWDRLLHRDFWHAFTGPALRPRLASFIVGTLVLATLIGLAAYFVVRAALRIYHRRHPRVAERAARRKRHRRETRKARIEEL